MDFTLNTLKKLLDSLQSDGSMFVTVSDYLKVSRHITKQIILRRDVDARPKNSLATAQLEHELGIRGTYYFRMVPGSYDETVIRKIAGLGHEIGYHYETLSQAGIRLSVFSNRSDALNEEKMVDDAYQLFTENLAKLREIVSVETICMHGSPLSRFDNREIWKKYNYRELGIIGEASMDVDFSKVAYYTDTGRRWDGASMSVRDKVQTRLRDEEKKGNGSDRLSVIGDRLISGAQHAQNFQDKRFPVFHSTFDMIKAVENGKFPEQAMITIHPQRWNDSLIPWTKELVWQNVKNVGKWLLVKYS